MLRCLVILASVLSVITSVQALPVNTSPHANAPNTASPSEPATLMGHQYQVAKREPLILMDPAFESAQRESRHNHAETQLLRKRVAPFPRYVLERSLDALEVREIHTPAHTESKQPSINKFSEPAPPAPLPPHNDVPEHVVGSSNDATTQEYGANKHREAYSQAGSGLGLAALGLGGGGGSTPDIGALGLTSHGTPSSGAPGLNALGGLLHS